MAKIIDPNYPPYKDVSTVGASFIRKESFRNEMNANRIFDKDQIEWYTKFSRFPILDPYNALAGSKEYVFFTKPDLHLLDYGTDELNKELLREPFFKEIYLRYRDIMYQLQHSAGSNRNPFMPLLSNALKSSLDLPEISANEIDGPATIYGTTIKYRGTSFKSDEEFDFSLEFGDTKYLEVYLLMKTWDMYYRNRIFGTITPVREDYTIWKTLDDQISIYKFIVAEDGESIVHFSKLYGCYPMNVPRNIFSEGNKFDGVNFTISWKAQFIDDMDPLILRDFNVLTTPFLQYYGKDVPLYDKTTDSTNGKWASLPYIYLDTSNPSDGGFGKYKLKWKGEN